MTQRTPRRLANRRLLLILLLAALLGSFSPAASEAQAQDEPPLPPDAGARHDAARERYIEELRQEVLGDMDLMQPAFAAGAGIDPRFAFTDCSEVIDVPQAECEALVEVYNTTGGPDWTYNDGWLEYNAVCSWEKVACNAERRVWRLNLVGNVTGEMPAAIGDLTELIWLYLYSYPGFVSGPIPEEYANLTKLEFLFLGDTNRTGPMPAWIGELSQLKQLFLDDNPGFEAGPIPEEFVNLSNLHDLLLANTNRTGPMPAWLADMPALLGFDLSDNPGFQSGPIPAEYSKFATVTDFGALLLGNTNRTGEIPAWMGDLTDLEMLGLQGNHLTGTIPAELGNLTLVYEFDLSGNALEGEIPSSIIQVGSSADVPSHWYYFDIGYNMLTASDPAVVTFLDAHDPDWAATQTIPPADLQVAHGTPTSATLTWTPIRYTANGGFYEVSYATSSEGPWTVHGTTADKTVGSYTMGGLQPDTDYYFRVRTHTPAFDGQPNDLWSPYGEMVAWTSPLDLFADVPPPGKEWMQPWIELLYAEGITGGCGQNPLRYCPEDPVTRAQMAAFILRAEHGSGYAPPNAAGTFADVPVPGKEWAEPWIERLYAEGITTGCGQNPLRYCPENPVTRGQMAAFLLRAKYGADHVPPAATGVFADVPMDHWSAPWVEQLYAEGITTGCGQAPLRYCPDQAVTRGQMAAFILRAFDDLPKPE